MCSYVGGVATLLTGLVLVAVSSYVGYGVIPDLVNRIIKSEVQLINGTQQMSRFEEVPFALEFNVRIFNITNPTELLSGAVPVVEELGPYVFQSFQSRIIEDMEDDAIAYHRLDNISFDQNKSYPLTVDDIVTVVNLPYHVRAVDLLHKAAFRRGLGNSLFISPKKIGKISSESLQHFASSTLSPGRCAITVVGGTQETAVLVAQALQLPSGTEAQSNASNYSSGELRKEMGGDLAHVALAVQGAPAGSSQSLALAVAAKALGSGPVTKWGADNTPIAKAIGNVGPFAAAGFNVSYSDTGLFGVILSVAKDEANAAVKSAAKLLKNLKLSPEAIAVGKNQLKIQVLSEAEEGTTLAESMVAQGLYTGNVKSPATIAKEIEQISSSDVSQALSNATSSKISIGAAGNLAFVPYADEL